MSQSEDPKLLQPQHRVSIEDVHKLMGASTPHFALQLRERIKRLIQDLPAQDPARILGEQEITRLEQLAFSGESRGTAAKEDHRPMPSLSRPNLRA